MADDKCTPSGQTETDCEHCKKPEGYLNHVPGHIFVGMGHGWQPCVYCKGTGKKPPESVDPGGFAPRARAWWDAQDYRAKPEEVVASLTTLLNEVYCEAVVQPMGQETDRIEDLKKAIAARDEGLAYEKHRADEAEARLGQGSPLRCMACRKSDAVVCLNCGDDIGRRNAREDGTHVVRSDTVRESADGTERIAVFGCYGYGSQGALHWVSLPNDLKIRSPNGMGAQEILAKYPRVVRGEPRTEHARLDEDRTAKPKTEIVGHFPAGKKNFYDNAERLEVRTPPMGYATEEQMREAGPSPAEMARAHAEDVRRRATQPMAEVGELTKRIRAQQGPMLSKEETVAQINEVIRQRPEFIIPCVLFCPHCKKQHIDEGIWATRPHRTHQCVTDAAGEGCGSPFTPSAHRTVGVWYKDLKFTALEEPKEPKR